MSDEICRPQIRGLKKFQSFFLPKLPFSKRPNCDHPRFLKVEDTLHCPPLLFVNLVTETFGLESWNLGNPNFGLQNVEKGFRMSKIYCCQQMLFNAKWVYECICFSLSAVKCYKNVHLKTILLHVLTSLLKINKSYRSPVVFFPPKRSG